MSCADRCCASGHRRKPHHGDFTDCARGHGRAARHAVSEASSYAARWAGPRAEAAIEWVTPRARTAWHHGVMAAAPRVSEAARLLSPKIDIARDRLKEQVLPAIVDAVNRAAEVAAQSAGAPALVVQPPPKKHRLCRFLGWSALLGALGAIAYAVWARRELDADPWSEDDAWGADDVSFVPTSQAAGEADSSEDQPAAKEALSDLGSAAEAAAEAVGEKTGEAVRKVSSASKKAAEAAHTAVGKAKRAAASVADAARQTTSSNDDEEAGGQSAAPSADSKDDAGKSGS